MATQTQIRNALLKNANAHAKKYPQYVGHFDKYVLVQVTKTVKGKAGVAFVEGEYAIGEPQVRENGFRTLWSTRLQIDFSTPSTKYVVVS